LLGSFLLGVLFASAVFEVRIWKHWEQEAQTQVAASDVLARDAAHRAQAEAHRAAIAKLNAAIHPAPPVDVGAQMSALGKAHAERSRALTVGD